MLRSIGLVGLFLIVCVVSSQFIFQPAELEVYAVFIDEVQVGEVFVMPRNMTIRAQNIKPVISPADTFIMNRTRFIRLADTLHFYDTRVLSSRTRVQVVQVIRDRVMLKVVGPTPGGTIAIPDDDPGPVSVTYTARLTTCPRGTLFILKRGSLFRPGDMNQLLVERRQARRWEQSQLAQR